MEIPLSLRTTGPAGAPEWPDDNPRIEVWRTSDMTRLRAFQLASYIPGVQVGSFFGTVFLGALFGSAGTYSVFFRWVDSDGDPRQRVDTFELAAGGKSAGTVLSMTQAIRPDANYLLTAT